MVNKVVLTDPTSLANESTFLGVIAANNAAITAAMQNTMSLDGTSPNTPSADIDMNSKRIINLPAPVNNTEPARKVDLGTYTADASASAAAALLSEQNALASEQAAGVSAASALNSAAGVAADKAQTGLDAIATAADRVQTGLDVIDTGADAAQTALDVIDTGADATQTALDVIATAADRVQTGLDVIATAADRVQTGLDALATAADRVQTGLDRVATTQSASDAADSASDAQGYAASIDPATLAKVDLTNVVLTPRSESSSFTVGTADNNKSIFVTAAATITEAAGAAACVAGNVIRINNTGTKAGGYLVAVSLTIDGVSGRVLVGGESLTLLALGSGAFRTIAEHIEPWSFWGYNSASRTNNSGDNTEEHLECDTVVHNIGGQLSGRTHTAMASCVCSYAANISISNLASNHTRLVVFLRRSNGDICMDYSNPYAQMDPGDKYLIRAYCSPKVDQDSGDIAYCRYKVAGGSKVVTLNGGRETGFSGEFIRSLT